MVIVRPTFWGSFVKTMKKWLLDGTFCASRYLYDNLTRAKVGTAPVNSSDLLDIKIL